MKGVNERQSVKFIICNENKSIREKRGRDNFLVIISSQRVISDISKCCFFDDDEVEISRELNARENNCMALGVSSDVTADLGKFVVKSHEFQRRTETLTRRVEHLVEFIAVCSLRFNRIVARWNRLQEKTAWSKRHHFPREIHRVIYTLLSLNKRETFGSR